MYMKIKGKILKGRRNSEIGGGGDKKVVNKEK